MKGDVAVMPDGEGRWKVQRDGDERALYVADTQTEAVELARRIAQFHRAELRIHRPDGQIRAKDSHGRDKYPPRG